MIDDPFRKILPRYTKRLISLYQVLHLKPNHVTLIALFLAFVSAALILGKEFELAISTWWLGRLLDGTDGIFARTIKQTSLFGAFLDIVCDMCAYSVIIVALAAVFPEYQMLWIATLLLYVLCITSALALGNLELQSNLPSKDNRGLRLAAGLAEGGETGIAYTIMLLAPKFLHYTLSLWVALLALTVLARTALAFRELK